MTTKSGTNALHGSAYGYFRNKSLNAQDFFSKLNNVEKPNWSQYQYGATLSGPVVKDKLFFFGSWEGFSSRVGVPFPALIPSEEARNGIFHVRITDPTGRGCVSQTGANTWQIDPSCFDPSSLVFRDTWYPHPNADNPAYNWFTITDVGNDGNQFNGRMDYNVSDQHRIFARYSYWTAQDIPKNMYLNMSVANGASQNIAHQAVIGDTYTFSPTTVLDLRLSYLRGYYDDKVPDQSVDLSMFGPNWGALNGQVTFQTTPTYNWRGTHSYKTTAGIFTSLRYWNVYGFSAGLTKILGNHAMKVGGEVRLMDNNSTGTGNEVTGKMTFDTSLVGDEYAAFLLGVPTSLAINKLYPSSTYNWYQGYYLADTWTVNKRLTLSLGLRWELPGTTAERTDRATVLLPDTVDPATNVRGTLALVRSDLWPSRNMGKTRYNLFAPRLGFAYRLDESGRTVFRGGYGLNYLPPDIGGGMYATSSPINTARNVWNNRKNPTTGLMVEPYRTVSNPFPQGPPSRPGAATPTSCRTYWDRTSVAITRTTITPMRTNGTSVWDASSKGTGWWTRLCGIRGKEPAVEPQFAAQSTRDPVLRPGRWTAGDLAHESLDDGGPELEALPLLPERGPRRLRGKEELSFRDGSDGEAVRPRRRDLRQLHVVAGQG